MGIAHEAVLTIISKMLRGPTQLRRYSISAIFRAGFRSRVPSNFDLSIRDAAPRSILPRTERASYRPMEPISRKDLPTLVTRERMVELAVEAVSPSATALMALDVSHTKVGIAVTDPSRSFVTPSIVVKRHGRDRLPQDPTILATRIMSAGDAVGGVCGVVVGWPKDLDGTVGRQCYPILTFLKDIYSSGLLGGIPFLLWDERFSTVEAKNILRESGRAHIVSTRHDAVAAAVILERFLKWGRESDQGNVFKLSTIGNEEVTEAAFIERWKRRDG